MVQIQPVGLPQTPLVRPLSQHSQPSLRWLTPSIPAGWPTPLSGQISRLYEMGWTVMRLWQHDLERDYEASIQSIVRTVRLKAAA